MTEPEATFVAYKLSDDPRWSISRNAVEFVGEFAEPGEPVSFQLVGTTEEILLERIAARQAYRAENFPTPEEE